MGRSRSPKSRRWDGEAESAADRRFFDLREAGFRDPIDHDGNPQTPDEHERWLDEHRPGGWPA